MNQPNPLSSLFREVLAMPRETATPITLTHKQRFVLRLICRGYTNRAIGKEWGRSERYIKYITRQLFNSTRTRSRLALAIWAFHQYGFPQLERLD